MKYPEAAERSADRTWQQLRARFPTGYAKVVKISPPMMYHAETYSPENPTLNEGRDELLGTSGPSVVFLNGTLASLAVTEFATFVTGLRPPLPHLNYRGEMGIVTTTKAPGAGCYYCDSVWSGRSIVRPERYLSMKG